MNNLIIFGSSLVLMIILDYLWLGFIAKNFFKSRLKYFLSGEVKWISALMFYIIFIVGILVFVVYPAIDEKSVFKAIYFGAFLGLIAYGTYDLTNHAFFKKWPISVMFVDISWGIFVSALVSFFAYNLTIFLG